jgi:hypothetical protein
MLVYRVTYLVKRGSMSELQQVISTGLTAMTPPHGVRALVRSYGGPMDVLVYEFEFEDIQEHEEYWAEWFATRAEAFFDKVNPLVEHVSREIWRVVG